MTSAPPQLGDEWYQSEPPTRLGLVAEVQRIRRRTQVRPIPVLALALVVTAGITYKVATKPFAVGADVVLALTEGAMASTRQTNDLPVDQLRQYVTSVLLPDAKLIQLIEKYDLYRLRKKLGPQFAIEQLRGNLEVQIWKNSFAYFDAEGQNATRSARIGLTVTDSDADRAFDVARDLASIVIESLANERQKLTDALSHDVAMYRDQVNTRIDKLADEISETAVALDVARRREQPEHAGILRLHLAALAHDRERAEDQLIQITSSRDALAGAIAAAGLDMSLAVVEEHRPERPTRSELVLIMIAVVVGTGALVGAALVLGAFDSRVHDADDVTRLGLPVLGHVPGFAGDKVGSMQTRSAVRARVPSFRRWRSHR